MYDFVITVSDGERTDTQSWSVTVNTPPAITSTPPDEAAVGQAYVYDIIATDVDGDPLTYELDDRSSAGAVLNGNRLEWTPTAEQVNRYYRFIVTVSDGKSSTQKDWSVKVVPGSEPPVFTSTPPESATVGQTYVYDITATDPEGNPLTYELNDYHGAGAKLNGNRLEWTPTLTQGNDWWTFIVTVRDSTGASAQQKWKVTVAPVVTNDAPTTATVGTPYVYDIEASVAGLSYELTDAPDGATLSGNRVAWTPTAAQVNRSYYFRLLVSDGQDSIARYWDVRVAPGSQPPVFTSTPPATATVGVPYVYTITAEDPEGNPMTYELNDYHSVGAKLNGNRLEWTPEPRYGGDWWRFIVTVTDSTGASAQQDWRVDVENAD